MRGKVGKGLSGVLALALCMGMTACAGGADAPAQTSSPQPTQQVQATPQPTAQAAATPAKFSSAAVMEQLDVQKYIYTSMNSNFAALAITNHSEFVIDIDASAKLTKGGTPQGAEQGMAFNVEPEQTAVVRFVTEAEFDEFEYALTLSQVTVDEYYMGYTSHIDCDVTSDGKTATVVLANTGDKSAMADCNVLFFKGDQLVDIGLASADLQPGDEGTQIVSAFHDKSFDTVQAYVSAMTLD